MEIIPPNQWKTEAELTQYSQTELNAFKQVSRNIFKTIMQILMYKTQKEMEQELIKIRKEIKENAKKLTQK